jgi:hypothetical protein
MELPDGCVSGTIAITDVLGRVIASMPVTGQKMHVTDMEFKGVAAGNYFIKVMAGDRSYHKKITVVK